MTILSVGVAWQMRAEGQTVSPQWTPGPTRTPFLANAPTGVVTSTPSALSTAARFHNFFLEFKKLLPSVTASHAIQLQVPFGPHYRRGGHSRAALPCSARSLVDVRELVPRPLPTVQTIAHLNSTLEHESSTKHS